MPNAIRLDRARGSLLGMAVGDALGAPLEGLSAQQIRAQYGQVVDYVDGFKAWRRKPFRWRMPGLYTDDTQQALVLSDVLLRLGRIDPAEVVDLYLRLATPDGGFVGAHRGVGRSFRLLLEALKSDTGRHVPGRRSAGIGAAMRIAPVGLYFTGPDDADALFEAVMASSLLTHRDIRSLAGALTVAFAVRRLALGESGRAASYFLRLAGDVSRAEDRIASEYADAVDGIAEFGKSFSRAVARIEPILDKPREVVLSAILDEANRNGPDSPCRKPTQGFPPALIPTCLYLLYSSDSFEDALLDTVNLGGDADTAGAIVGALAGAHFGLAAIPDRLLARLMNKDSLTLRADALAHHSYDGLDTNEMIEMERWLSDRETAYRDALMALRPSGGDLDCRHV